jgi:regulator of extracellular matrix RemA (YlzA/DUF370 family)
VRSCSALFRRIVIINATSAVLSVIHPETIFSQLYFARLLLHLIFQQLNMSV